MRYFLLFIFVLSSAVFFFPNKAYGVEVSSGFHIECHDGGGFGGSTTRWDYSHIGGQAFAWSSVHTTNDDPPPRVEVWLSRSSTVQGDSTYWLVQPPNRPSYNSDIGGDRTPYQYMIDDVRMETGRKSVPRHGTGRDGSAGKLDSGGSGLVTAKRSGQRFPDHDRCRERRCAGLGGNRRQIRRALPRTGASPLVRSGGRPCRGRVPGREALEYDWPPRGPLAPESTAHNRHHAPIDPAGCGRMRRGRRQSHQRGVVNRMLVQRCDELARRAQDPSRI